ncbi:sugar ABC transporter permease [Bacillus taeanensis]|uniref:Sugar ABC transporter permease n=2 Tax=Bacillus taeanensis TaxID=273032 RepID=A0A366Y110_9BACI|nr:sugar ABC transporter permease [Bacillus taeanensis]
MLEKYKVMTNVKTNQAYKNKLKKALVITSFIGPAFMIYALYVLYSIGVTFYYSLFQWTGIDANKVFIGLGNYFQLIADRVFWLSLENNLILILASLLTQIPFGLIMALMLFAPIHGIRIFRTVYFLPLLMSTVAIGILFTFIFDANFGVVNQALAAVGLDSWQRGWLGDEQTAMWTVTATICWQFAPFYMILFRAAIVGIPEELYEAAKIDGASAVQRFKSITLPLLLPTIVTSSILAIIGSLKYFDLIYVMTNGGPNNSTELMATYMYKQAFTTFNMGYGSSISFGMFVIALLITTFVLGFDHYKKKKGDLV